MSRYTPTPRNHLQQPTPGPTSITDGCCFTPAYKGVCTQDGHLVFDGQTAPTAWPTVSLCMIVKNEAKNLAGCIESVGDFATEIIVVDTGSTDKTVDVARAYGATVKHFTWIDDFAAARNESIKDARGDWIFWLDADDRLALDSLNRLKQAAASGLADAYYCYVVSHFQESRIAEDRIEHLRLFRNHQGICFDKPLHEDAAPVAHRLGMTISRTNITINHTGYTVSQAALIQKSQRNLRIIQMMVERNPSDLYWRFHLGVTQQVLGDLKAAITQLEAVVANPPAHLDRDSYLYQAYEGLMLAYLGTGQADRARDAIQQAQQSFAYRQHFWIRAATVYVGLDEPEQAIQALLEAQRRPPDARGQSWATGTLETQLYQTYLLLANLDQARAAYRALLTRLGYPDQRVRPESLTQAGAWLAAGHHQAVIDSLQPVAQATPEALRLLAQAYQNEQAWESAFKVLSAAVVLNGVQPGEWATLAKYALHAQLGSAPARRLCHHALKENPDDADALNLLGIITSAQSGLAESLPYLIRALLTAPQHHAARHNLEEACRAINTTPAEALRHFGLGLMKQGTGPESSAQAVAAFSLINELEPDNGQAYRLMAVALQRLNCEAEALLCWQTAQRLEGK